MSAAFFLRFVINILIGDATKRFGVRRRSFSSFASGSRARFFVRQATRRSDRFDRAKASKAFFRRRRYSLPNDFVRPKISDVSLKFCQTPKRGSGKRTMKEAEKPPSAPKVGRDGAPRSHVGRKTRKIGFSAINVKIATYPFADRREPFEFDARRVEFCAFYRF